MNKRNQLLLHYMTWVDAKQYFAKNDTVILPVGSTEQHGPANPLGTDLLIAEALAERVSDQTGVACLPIVPFGASSHHRQFWGTVFVSPKSLKHYVRDICLSLKYYGVRKIVIVNGHGGNLAVLSELARELREKGIFISVFQWWSASIKLFPELFKPEERLHAGAEETSVNLALHKHLVDMTKALDETPRRHDLQVEGLTLPLDTADETSQGVFGTQRTASAAKGKRVLDAVVTELVKHVNTLKRQKPESLLAKPKL